MINSKELKKKTSRNGVSILEVIIGLGIITLVATAVGTVWNHSQKTIIKTEVNKSISVLNPDILGRLRRILFDIRPDKSQDKNREGICKLVSTDRVGPGVGPININLSKEKAAEALSASWDRAFASGWTSAADDSACPGENGWTRCFKPEPQLLSKENSDLEILLIAQIVPSSMEPARGNTFNPIYADSIDVKQVGFRLVAETLYKPKNQPADKPQVEYKKQLKTSFFWAAEVPYCDYQVDPQIDTDGDGVNDPPIWIKLAFSGTGPGDETASTLFNTFDFGKNQEPVITGAFNRVAAQRGTFDPSEGLLKTDVSANRKFSCNEVKYRCRNSAGQREFADTASASVILNFNRESDLARNINSTRMNPSFYFSKITGNGQNVVLNQNDLKYYLDGRYYEYRPFRQSTAKEFPVSGRYLWGPCVTKDNQGNCEAGFELDEKGNGIEMRLSSSSHFLNISLDNANNTCKQLCSDHPNTVYQPSLTVFLKDIPMGADTGGTLRDRIYRLIASNPATVDQVACTTCFMKNCGRLGLETFGPKEEQPYEPYDAQIPECALNQNNDVTNMNPYKDWPLTGLASNYCIAAKVNAAGNGLDLIRTSCGTALPNLCFDFGTYGLTKNINNSTLRTANGYKSSDSCYQMGHESIGKDKLIAHVTQSSGDPNSISILSTQPATMDYYNNAKQGINLAPQTEQQVHDAISRISEQGTSANQNFWVGLILDRAGSMIATPPFMQTLNGDKYKFSMFFEPNGAFRILKDDVDPRDLVSQKNPIGGLYALMLNNDVRYRGLVAVAPEQDNNHQYKFLCQKVSDAIWFISRSDSNRQSQGDDACNNEDGVFVTPLTPMAWTKALSLVNPLDANYPYPLPFDYREVGNGVGNQSLQFNRMRGKPVWTALESRYPDPGSQAWPLVGSVQPWDLSSASGMNHGSKSNADGDWKWANTSSCQASNVVDISGALLPTTSSCIVKGSSYDRNHTKQNCVPDPNSSSSGNSSNNSSNNSSGNSSGTICTDIVDPPFNASDYVGAANKVMCKDLGSNTMEMRNLNSCNGADKKVVTQTDMLGIENRVLWNIATRKDRAGKNANDFRIQLDP